MLQLTEATFDEEVKEGVVVVDFYAEWCGPCRLLSPKFKGWADQYPGVKFAKVDIEENQKIAVDCRVSHLPTVIVVKNGQEVRRWVGIPPDAEIASVLSSS